jgi:hypothetical protein
VQTYIDPLSRRAHNLGISTPAVDFGPADIRVWQQLIYGLLSLLLFTILMRSMIQNIPQIASNIGAASTGMSIQPSSFEPAIKNSIEQAKGNLLGGNK